MNPRIITLVTAIAVSLLSFTSCNKEKYIFIEGYELHTPYHITYKGGKTLDKEIKGILQKYYHSINTFDSTSIISKVNRNEAVILDDIFIHMFQRAMEIGEDTDGILDVTCGPLVNLWGFGEKNGLEITDDAITDALSLTGYDKVRILEGRVVKEAYGMQLNFAALGDGYSCDLVAEVLKENGIHDFCIEIGGEIVAAGKNPKGKPWRVGIIEPVYENDTEDQTITRIVEIDEEKGMATSGDYRNFRKYKGRKIGHIINPKEGCPAESDVVSATVIAKDGITADGYATAFMVMGSKMVQEFMKGRDDMEYFLICRSSDTTTFVVKSPDF